MLKYVLFFVLLFQSSTAEAGIFDLITTVVREVGKGVDFVTEEVFRKTMVAKTIENVATLQRNFDESKRFHDEMRKIYHRPATLTDHAREETLSRLRRSKDHAVHIAEMDYQRHYGKPGYIDRAFKQTDEYIRTSLDFSDEARKLIRGKAAEQKEIVEDLPKEGDESDQARKDREAAELRNDFLQTELLIAMNKNIIESHRALARLHQELSGDRARAAARMRKWAEEVERLRKDVREGRAGKHVSSEEAVRDLLR